MGYGPLASVIFLSLLIISLFGGGGGTFELKGSAEIFVIEKRLPDSPSRGVNKIAYRYNIFKPLNKSIVIVHYIPGLFFC
jgi:hypothetical protein